MANNKKDSFRKTREGGLNWMGSKLPSWLGGNVVKAKRKHKKKLREVTRGNTGY